MPMTDLNGDVMEIVGMSGSRVDDCSGRGTNVASTVDCVDRDNMPAGGQVLDRGGRLRLASNVDDPTLVVAPSGMTFVPSSSTW